MKRRSIARLAPVAAASAAALLTVGISSPAYAASTNASVQNDTLTITGSPASDSLALRLAANSDQTLEVDFGDNGTADFSFDRNTFSRIAISLRNGNDHFRVDEANGTFTDEAITVSGDNGSDTMEGGGGSEVFFGGAGNDFVDGNKGNDAASLSSGFDTFRWDPGDGSDLIDGASGRDTLEFNGADADEVMSLTKSGSLAVFNRDLGNIRMVMDNVDDLDLNALGGADQVTIGDMSGTDFRAANVNLAADTGSPDGASDLVTIDGSPQADRISLGSDGPQVVAQGSTIIDTNISGAELADKVQVDSGDGNDRVTVDGTVFALMDIGVDLGAGQL